MHIQSGELATLLKEIIQLREVDALALRQCLEGLEPPDSYSLLTNTLGTFGGSVLHSASAKNYVEVVDIISGVLSADQWFTLVKIQDNSGYTALHWAAGRGHTDILRCIIESITSEQRFEILQLQDGFNHTAVHLASGRGHIQTLRCIADALPADQAADLLKLQNINGETAAHRAAYGGQTECIEVMLSSLTPQQQLQLLEIKDVNESTALDRAIDATNKDTVEFIIEITEKAKTKDMQVETDLCILAEGIENLKQHSDQLLKQVDELQQTFKKRRIEFEEQQALVAKLESSKLSSAAKTQDASSVLAAWDVRTKPEIVAVQPDE